MKHIMQNTRFCSAVLVVKKSVVGEYQQNYNFLCMDNQNSPFQTKEKEKELTI
jgi:hypothetical protein